MRHVDDAHHPEGDGEADRGEQQNAAEAQPLEKIGDDADELQPPVDRGDRSVHGFFQLGIEVGPGAEFVEQALDLRIGNAGKTLDRGKLIGLAAIHQLRGEEARLDRRADFGIGFVGERFLKPRGALRRGVFQRVACGGETRIAIGAEQCEAAERGLDAAAQPIIDNDAIEIVRCDPGHRVAGQGIGQLCRIVGGDDQDLAVRSRPQAVVAHRLKDRHRPAVAKIAETDNRLFLLGKCVAAERADQRSEIVCPRRQRRCEQQHDQDGKMGESLARPASGHG
jgi:hypothetical protein